MRLHEIVTDSFDMLKMMGYGDEVMSSSSSVKTVKHKTDSAWRMFLQVRSFPNNLDFEWDKIDY